MHNRSLTTISSFIEKQQSKTLCSVNLCLRGIIYNVCLPSSLHWMYAYITETKQNSFNSSNIYLSPTEKCKALFS